MTAPLMTVAEYADAVRLTEKYVRSLVDDGLVKSVRVGRGRGSVRIPRSELDSLLEGICE